MLLLRCEDIDNRIDANQWLFTTNTPKDVPQQQNNYQCSLFLCFFARSAIQAATILVAMASEKNIWWLKFWQKSPIGTQQIIKEIYLEN